MMQAGQLQGGMGMQLSAAASAQASRAPLPDNPYPANDSGGAAPLAAAASGGTLNFSAKPFTLGDSSGSGASGGGGAPAVLAGQGGSGPGPRSGGAGPAHPSEAGSASPSTSQEPGPSGWRHHRAATPPGGAREEAHSQETRQPDPLLAAAPPLNADGAPALH